MKKYKSIFPIILCMIILCSGFTVSADSGDLIVLTLEEAQKRALQNSLEYRQQDDRINDSLENYYDTANNYDKSYSTASRGFYEYFMMPVNLETSLQSAINSVKSERLKKENIRRTSNLNVLKAFINIKKAQYALEDAKLNTGLRSKEYESAKTKYSLDLIKKAELEQALSAYNNARDSEASAHKSLQKEYQALNRYLGRELTDYNLKLVIDFELIDISSIDLGKLREDYIAHSDSLTNLELKAKLAERKYDITKERYEEFAKRLSVQNSREQMEEAFDDAVSEYESARKAFEDATIDLDISLKESYDSLKSTYDSILDLLDDIEEAKDKVEKSRILYDMSLISKAEFDKASMEASTLNNKLQSSLADLRLKYSTLMMYSE